MGECIDMGLTKAQKAERLNHRRDQILKEVRKPGGATGSQLARTFGVSRGTILNDIAHLRRKGYPIQISSTTEEGGIMVAVYELPRHLPMPR